MALRVPVDTASSHIQNLPQEPTAQETSEPETDEDQDLETATFLGSIWNLFRDTKELSQELLKDTKELASKELDTLLDRLPFGQAKSKESEDTDATSDDLTTDINQQQRLSQRQHRRRQPLQRQSASLGNLTFMSSTIDGPVLPLKKSGKLSRESSISRTREPGLSGERRGSGAKRVLGETLKTSFTTYKTTTEDLTSYSDTATTADHPQGYSPMRPSVALYPAAQELPPSPTLRIQRNISLRDLSYREKLPVEETLSQDSTVGLQSTSTSALATTSNSALSIQSLEPLAPLPPSPSLPSPSSQEAEDKLAAVLKELADVKQQVLGIQALREQMGQIEALKDQIAGLVSSRETVVQQTASTPDRHKSPPSPPPPPPSINNKWLPNKSAMDNVLQELRSPRTPLRQTNSPFLKRAIPAAANSPLVSRVTKSPLVVKVDNDELDWPTPGRLQKANERLDAAAKELCTRDFSVAITPAKRAVKKLSEGMKEQTYKPKKTRLTRPLPPRAKTLGRLPLSELCSPLLNQNRDEGVLDSSSLDKEKRHVSFHQDITDVERQWYLESDKDSWRVNI
ncbi:hypothetical protein EMPS_03517 [Entomortierella parvispora]|uniref:Uncharacterized protein n=1 Tax=Entomortierella parvispora TaxID=205924 RepID=A0A9P3LUN5_9FUNG|nr:hypothetical protein EMPS_03517 [Entomortierella parvispora]